MLVCVLFTFIFLTFCCWHLRKGVLNLQKCSLNRHPVCGRWAGFSPLPPSSCTCLALAARFASAAFLYSLHGFPGRTKFCCVNAPERMQRANGYFHLYLVSGCVLRWVCYFGFLRTGTESSQRPWNNKLILCLLDFDLKVYDGIINSIQLTFKNMFIMRQRRGHNCVELKNHSVLNIQLVCLVQNGIIFLII